MMRLPPFMNPGSRPGIQPVPFGMPGGIPGQMPGKMPFPGQPFPAQPSPGMPGQLPPGMPVMPQQRGTFNPQPFDGPGLGGMGGKRRSVVGLGLGRRKGAPTSALY